uniref:Uncharacterized protein n=1 Tax=Panagrolaimus davidi TaxID=227884 RepID=A0A914PQZ1_9BILA
MMTSVVKNEKAEPSKVLNNSTDETASTDSDDNDPEFKPNEKRKKTTIPKVITNVLESILPNKIGKKNRPTEAPQKQPFGKTKNEKIASQSIKAATTKAPTKDDTTPAAATTTAKPKEVKKPPSKKNPHIQDRRAPTEERKKALIGNLKPVRFFLYHKLEKSKKKVLETNVVKKIRNKLIN